MLKRTVGFSTEQADTAGARKFIVDGETINFTARDGRRRVTRTPTLDGGAVVYDAGFSIADKTFKMQLRANTLMDTSFIQYLVTAYNRIRISTIDGVFIAVPESWLLENGIITFQALVIEQRA